MYNSCVSGLRVLIWRVRGVWRQQGGVDAARRGWGRGGALLWRAAPRRGPQGEAWNGKLRVPAEVSRLSMLQIDGCTQVPRPGSVTLHTSCAGLSFFHGCQSTRNGACNHSWANYPALSCRNLRGGAWCAFQPRHTYSAHLYLCSQTSRRAGRHLMATSRQPRFLLPLRRSNHYIHTLTATLRAM